MLWKSSYSMMGLLTTAWEIDASKRRLVIHLRDHSPSPPPSFLTCTASLTFPAFHSRVRRDPLSNHLLNVLITDRPKAVLPSPPCRCKATSPPHDSHHPHLHHSGAQFQPPDNGTFQLLSRNSSAFRKGINPTPPLSGVLSGRGQGHRSIGIHPAVPTPTLPLISRNTHAMKGPILAPPLLSSFLFHSCLAIQI